MENETKKYLGIPIRAELQSIFNFTSPIGICKRFIDDSCQKLEILGNHLMQSFPHYLASGSLPHYPVSREPLADYLFLTVGYTSKEIYLKNDI